MAYKTYRILKDGTKLRFCNVCKQFLSLGCFWFSEKRNCYHSCCKVCSTRVGQKNRHIKFSGSWFTAKYGHLKKNAKKRGIEFALSKQEFIDFRLKDKCFYCVEYADVMTIDRVDNNIGHKKENCVLACYSCNILKKNYSKEDILRFIKIAGKLL